MTSKCTIRTGCLMLLLVAIPATTSAAESAGSGFTAVPTERLQRQRAGESEGSRWQTTRDSDGRQAANYPGGGELPFDPAMGSDSRQSFEAEESGGVD